MVERTDYNKSSGQTDNDKVFTSEEQLLKTSKHLRIGNEQKAYCFDLFHAAATRWKSAAPMLLARSSQPE